MKLEDFFLVTFCFTGAVLVFVESGKHHDDDDDDDHNHGDHDDDDDGRPNYCPKDNGMFPNKNDCTSFYTCVDGDAILQTCAPGLLFDPKNKICNFPNQVKCKNECRGPNGLFPSQHRCDEFILCTDGKPERKRCKKGLYFDVNLQVCNYKSQVLCNLPKGGKKSKVYEPTRQCPKPNGIFPNKSNCSSFYLCNNGVHFKQECPGGLHYDRKRIKCDFPKKAKCKIAGRYMKKQTTKPPATEKPKPKKSKQCPEMDGIFPNPANCSTFYFCVDGAAYLQECPQFLVFDARSVKCDFPRNVGCKPPPGIRSVLRCPTEDGLFRHPTECGTFFLCKKGRSYEYHCPENLVFDYNSKRCEYSRTVKCPEHYLDRRKHIHNYMRVVQINIHDYVT